MVIKDMCFLLLMVTNTAARLDGTNLTRDIVSTFCAYTDFCHDKALKILNSSTGTPCCSSCSCEADFRQTKNCCPDKQIDSHHPVSNLTCETTDVKHASWDDFPLSSVRYFLTDKCPIDEKNVVVHNKCSSENPTTLEDVLWVSDPVTGRVFRNRHCAVCHGVNKWENWDIRASCKEVLLASISNVSSVIFSGDCSIQMAAPVSDGMNSERFRCDAAVFSTCNQTGLWKDYDNDIAEACEYYNLMFTQRRFTFKNVFCYICNAGSSQPDNFCPGTKAEIYPVFKFYTLIQLTTEEVPESQCEEDEMFDKYTDLCRKLACPLGEAPYYGHCQPIARTVRYLGIKIYFRLNVSSNVTSITESEGKIILKEFWKISGLRRCPLCRAQLQLDTARLNSPPADLLVLLVVQTDTQCQLDYLYNKTAMLIGENFRIVSRKKELNFTIDIAEEADDYVHISIIERNIRCYESLVLKPPFCPTIQISYREVESLANKDVKDALVAVFQNVTGTMKQSVMSLCINDYTNIVSPNSGKEPGREIFIEPHSSCGASDLNFLFALNGGLLVLNVVLNN